MPRPRAFSLLWVGSAFALGLAAGSCTPGGQFDPTELLSNDVFSTKKTLQGDREPLFPNGVPGAETGVPPDLVKGYQPPPEQAADSGDVTAKPVAEPVKPKPKPKPKPVVARAPAPAPQTVQGVQSPWPAPPKPASAQANWPAPPPTGQAQQATQPVQTNWPPPPPTGQAQQAAPPGQSIWPNPPTSAAPGTSSH
jgi:hypothetical protein